MSCAEHAWIDATDEQGENLSPGVRYQVLYDVGKMVGGIGAGVPERQVALYVMGQQPGGFHVEDVDLLNLDGGAVFTIVTTTSGPADRILPAELQVPQVGFGDVLLELSKVRYCQALTDPEIRGAEVQEREQVRDVEKGRAGGPLAPLKEFLEDFRTAAIVGGVVAGIILLLILLFMAGRIRQDLTS